VHHHINIGETLLKVVVDASLPLSGQFPAKAISLLDSAAAAAVRGGENEHSVCDVQMAAARFAGDDQESSCSRTWP
jgi:hypothetical protein